ncbi:MAG: hypothetical protein ABI425_06190 [Patescibacteria group bacterium]
MLVKDQLCKFVFKKLPLFFPEKKATSTHFGICMLLCHKDMTMALYSLQSLFFHLGYALPLYIIDDGSLTKSDSATLRKLFTITIDTKSKALLKIRTNFGNYPTLLKYMEDEKNHVKRMKVAALLLSPFQKIICLEPDVLFFHLPAEIQSFKKTGKNYFGVLHQAVYEQQFVHDNMMEMHFRRLLYFHLKLDIHFLFNGGFLLLNKDTINKVSLAKIEKTLRIFYTVDYARMFYAEETILATLFEVNNSVLLPYPGYVNLVYPIEYDRTLPNRASAIHFITPTRLIFIYQGVKLALRSRLFSKK